MDNTSIFIPSSGYLERILLRDIVMCKADGSYLIIYLINNEERNVSKNLSWLEKKVNSKYFFRVHHSFLVNILHVNKVQNNENIVCLINKLNVPIARRRKKIFLKIIEEV